MYIKRKNRVNARSVLLFLAVILTAAFFVYSYKKIPTYTSFFGDNDSFEIEAELLTDEIQEEMQNHIEVLYAARALFAVSDTVTRTDWHTYMKSLDLIRRHSGISAVSYLALVTDSEKSTFEESIRNDRSLSAEGYPDIKIYPVQKKDQYLAIKYIEPMINSNQRSSLGYDFLSDPKRYATYEKARDKNRAVASGIVEGVVTNARSFLIVLPVFESGAEIETPEQRKKAHRGQINIAFRLPEVFLEIFPKEKAGYMRLEIYDGSQLIPENKLYDSAEIFDQPLEPGSKRVITKTIEVAQSLWTVRVTEL